MPVPLVDPAFAKQIKGCRLVTADILYRIPDHPCVLQSFLWQEFDYVNVTPRFPILNRFLRFWEDTLDGKLHSVRVACTGIIAPTDLKYCKGYYDLN